MEQTSLYARLASADDEFSGIFDAARTKLHEIVGLVALGGEEAELVRIREVEAEFEATFEKMDHLITDVTARLEEEPSPSPPPSS